MLLVEYIEVYFAGNLDRDRISRRRIEVVERRGITIGIIARVIKMNAN